MSLILSYQMASKSVGHTCDSWSHIKAKFLVNINELFVFQAVVKAILFLQAKWVKSRQSSQAAGSVVNGVMVSETARRRRRKSPTQARDATCADGLGSPNMSVPDGPASKFFATTNWPCWKKTGNWAHHFLILRNRTLPPRLQVRHPRIMLTSAKPCGQLLRPLWPPTFLALFRTRGLRTWPTFWKFVGNSLDNLLKIFVEPFSFDFKAFHDAWKMSIP